MVDARLDEIADRRQRADLVGAVRRDPDPVARPDARADEGEHASGVDRRVAAIEVGQRHGRREPVETRLDPPRGARMQAVAVVEHDLPGNHRMLPSPAVRVQRGGVRPPGIDRAAARRTASTQAAPCATCSVVGAGFSDGVPPGTQPVATKRRWNQLATTRRRAHRATMPIAATLPSIRATFPTRKPNHWKSASPKVVPWNPIAPMTGIRKAANRVMINPFTKPPATAPRRPPVALPKTPAVPPVKKWGIIPGRISGTTRAAPRPAHRM